MADDAIHFDVVKTASDHKGAVPITKIWYNPTNIWDRVKSFNFFAYQCSLEEDLDGAVRAYGLNNPSPVNPGLNPDTSLQRNIQMLETSLANAGDLAANALFHIQNPNEPSTNRIFRWVGLKAATQQEARNNGVSIDARPFLEARASGRTDDGDLIVIPPGQPGLFPVIQGPGSPAEGYYVSTSAVSTGIGTEYNQRHWVDALTIPYGAWAGWWARFGVNKGDFGLAIRPSTGTFSGFVFADSGSGRVGEVSRNLFEALSPERNNEDQFVFLVFPGSGGGARPADKYTQEPVVQRQARMNLQSLNNIPGNGRIINFLAFDCDKAKFNQYEATKLPESDPVFRTAYLSQVTIQEALKICGFVLGPWPG